MVPQMLRRATPSLDYTAALSGSTACPTARVPSDWASLVGLLAALTMLAPPLTAKADSDSAGSVLNEVVVTAQRQSERSQDVPIAVTAVSADELRDRGIRQAADLASVVPNMLLNLPWGPEAQPTFTLRGVTTTDYSQNQSSPIAMYVDEVYKAVGAVQALQVFDMDRVEVLRGPQGNLYGQHATGRAVRASVGGPLIDNVLAARVAVYY